MDFIEAAGCPSATAAVHCLLLEPFHLVILNLHCNMIIDQGVPKKSRLIFSSVAVPEATARVHDIKIII